MDCCPGMINFPGIHLLKTAIFLFSFIRRKLNSSLAKQRLTYPAQSLLVKNPQIILLINADYLLIDSMVTWTYLYITTIQSILGNIRKILHLNNYTFFLENSKAPINKSPFICMCYSWSNKSRCRRFKNYSLNRASRTSSSF